MKSLMHSVCGLLIALAVPGATAQDFPSKPVRLVVASAPGISPDIVGRLFANDFTKLIGQPVIVENRPGANQVIGFEYVAKQSVPDGYTLLLTDVSGVALLPLISKGLRFDPLKDIAPVIGLVDGRLFLATGAGQPWKSVTELVSAIRANPGKYNYGASASANRFPTEAFVRGGNLEVTHIAYTSGAAYLLALIGGTVQMGTVAEGSIASSAEKLRALAVTGEQRHPTYKDVPTFAETGNGAIPGLTYALNVPLGTPEAVTAKLHAAASRTLQQPETKARFERAQWQVVERGPDVIAKMVQDQNRFFGDIARKAGIQPE